MPVSDWQPCGSHWTEVRESDGSHMHTLQIPRKMGGKGKLRAPCWSPWEADMGRGEQLRWGIEWENRVPAIMWNKSSVKHASGGATRAQAQIEFALKVETTVAPIGGQCEGGKASFLLRWAVGLRRQRQKWAFSPYNRGPESTRKGREGSDWDRKEEAREG